MAWTEDEFRKAGYVQKKLRLKKGTADALKREAAAAGVTESSLVERLLLELVERR